MVGGARVKETPPACAVLMPSGAGRSDAVLWRACASRLRLCGYGRRAGWRAYSRASGPIDASG